MQGTLILKQLQKGVRISSRDAVLNYGVQDLPKRISELRQAGHNIQSRRVYGVNRYGHKTHWSEYWLCNE